MGVGGYGSSFRPGRNWYTSTATAISKVQLQRDKISIQKRCEGGDGSNGRKTGSIKSSLVSGKDVGRTAVKSISIISIRIHRRDGGNPQRTDALRGGEGTTLFSRGAPIGNDEEAIATSTAYKKVFLMT